MHSSSRAGASRARSRPARRLAVPFALSLVMAATLGVVLYVAQSSLSFLVSSPGGDPLFGPLNRCLAEAVGEPRVGFAVSADGQAAASFGGKTLASCGFASPGGDPSLEQRLELPGVTSAAYDFSGALWLATSGGKEGDGALWLSRPGGPARVGEVAPISLAGHAFGVAALDGAGRLVSLAADGRALGFARLPSPPLGGAQLAVNADGRLLAVVAGTGLFLFRTEDLRLLKAEGPCGVEFLWWEPGEPSRALVSCSPGSSWALSLNAETGEKEAAPRRQRVESSLLPRLGKYVRPCEGLPCSAPAP